MWKEESLYGVILEDLCPYKGNSEDVEQEDQPTESVVAINPDIDYFDFSNAKTNLKFLSRENHNKAHSVKEHLLTTDEAALRFGNFIQTLSPEAQGVLKNKECAEGKYPFCDALLSKEAKPISFKDDVVIGDCVDVIVESSVISILKTTPTTGVALSGVMGKEYSAWEIEKVVRFRKLQILYVSKGLYRKRRL